MDINAHITAGITMAEGFTTSRSRAQVEAEIRHLVERALSGIGREIDVYVSLELA